MHVRQRRNRQVQAVTSLATKRLVSVLFALVAFALAGDARSQGTDASARASELKKRGDEAMDTGRPAEALAAYAEAYGLARDPALLYNKGRALQALTEYPRALEELEAFERTAPPELKQRVPTLQRIIGEVRQKLTTLSIACDVAGAHVRLRDRTIATCPVPAPLTVNAGRGALEVSAEGYFPWRRDADLPGGGNASFDVRLVSKKTSGVLVVKSGVPAALVTIDGKRLGNVPVEAMLPAGTHTIEVSHDGYRPAKTSAVVTAGEHRDVDVPLESEPTIFGRWWFWAGVGVVVAGGVAVVVALETERSPEHGTVAPGVIAAGLHTASPSGLGFRF